MRSPSGWPSSSEHASGLHFVGLLYILLGGFLAWRWPRAIVPHLPFAFWGLLVVMGVNPTHPLTWLEDRFREAQGLGPLAGGFNEYYIYGTLIPHRLLPLAAVLAVTLVLVSYAGALLRWRAGRDASET